jgi:hypothetical protein
VRTQAVIQPGSQPEEVGGNVGVVARFNPNTFSGYVGILDDGEQFALLRVDGGAIVELDGLDPIGIDAATDVIIELEAVGDQLNLFFWRPGEPKPDTPISSVTDSTYPSGRAGLVYNEDDDNTAGVFRFAAAQDTPFVDVLVGDLNGDGEVNFGDLTPFVTALTDIPAYESMYPGLDRVALCDVSGDGACNFGDLTPFANLLTAEGAQSTSVPEPGSAAFIATAVLWFTVRPGRWRYERYHKLLSFGS